VTIYSFDHDLGEFVGVGSATVSEDGQELVSEPGQGIVKGGWHLVPPTATPGECVGAGCALFRCTGCPAATCKRCNQPVGGLGTMCGPSFVPAPTFQWTPDSDCYVTVGVVCAGGCTPTFQPIGTACTRRYDGNGSATPLGALCGLAGTCEFNSGATKPVCCPGGKWSTNPTQGQFCDGPTCGAGHPVCCETTCDANGCCP